jgi:hypothetical protein
MSSDPPPLPTGGDDPFAAPAGTPPEPVIPAPPPAPTPAPPPPPPTAAGYPAPGFPAQGYPAQTYPAQGYGQPRQNSGKAIASMVLGIVGLLGAFFCGIGLIAAIVGLVLGYVAKREIRDSQGRLDGSGMATAGIVLGWVAVGLALVFVAIAVMASLPSGSSASVP